MSAEVKEEGWDKFAPAFASKALEWPGIPVSKDMLANLHRALSFSKATTVLDNGCGPGQAVSLLLDGYGDQLPPQARIVASDLSKGMIAQAEQLKQKHLAEGDERWKRVETAVHDAVDLSGFADGSVSHVIEGFMLFAVSDARQALRETRRVLSADGVLAASTWQLVEWFDIMRHISSVRPEKPVMKLQEPWMSEEGLRGELRATGFGHVETHLVDTAIPFDEPEEVVRFLVSSLPPVVMATKDMSPAEIDQAIALMVHELNQKHPTAPKSMKGRAIVAVARK